MKLLMFGATGQVAREVARRAGPHEVIALGREDADLTNPDACAARIASSDADVVLNAAAYTAVDKAESDEATAAIVNGEAPTAMAAAAAAKGVPFVQISTDYVFDGSGDAPRDEAAPTAPLGAYGWTKLAGEDGVRGAKGAHAIIRTSWVFSAHGANFVKTMLRLGAERDRLTIVDDQIGGPTPAAAIADACLTVADALARGTGESGVYHFAGAPDVSWRGFAEAIFAEAGLATEAAPIPTSEYPTPAKRPLNSRLDCGRIERIFGVTRPDWRAHLKDVIEEVRA
ncbi:MAG: dTDP-4-dehydrorhamnose reductase [Pseudomonadota bacterium]